MLFSSPPRTILFLTKDSLNLVSAKFKDVISLDLPTDLVANLEIADRDKFIKLVSDSISQVNLRGERVLIVLAEDILFQKNFTGPSEKLREQINEFVSEIPFDPEEIKKVEQKVKDGVAVVAANCQLYHAVAEAVSNLGGEVAAVVPVTVFTGLQNLNSLTKADLSLITSNPKLIQSANFYPKSGDNYSNPAKIILLILLFIWLILAILLILV